MYTPEIESTPKRVDTRWWDRRDYESAFTESLTAFYQQDQDLIAQDREFSVIAGVSKRGLSEVAQKIQDQLDPADRGSKAEIILTIRNAQLSFLIDDVTVAFLRDKPMPIGVFEDRLRRICISPQALRRFTDTYLSLLRQYEDDLSERAYEEPVADFILRTAEAGCIRPDWAPNDSKSRQMAVAETLKWVQEAIRAGYLVRDVGPKAGTTLERDAALVRLPFVDVVAYENSNFYLKQFQLTEEAVRQGVTYPPDYEKNLNLEALYIGEACITYGDTHRPFIEFSADSVGPPRLTEEEFEEQALQSLAHVRHEMKHCIDKKLRDERRANLPDAFYFPEKTFPKNGRGPRTVDEAIRFETQALLDEARALSIDGKLLDGEGEFDGPDKIYYRERPPFESYINTSIFRLKSKTKDGDVSSEKIAAFRESWRELLDFLAKHWGQFKEVSYKSDYRFMHLVIYHCIATAETPEELLSRLKHAMAWIKTEME